MTIKPRRLRALQVQMSQFSNAVIRQTGQLGGSREHNLQYEYRNGNTTIDMQLIDLTRDNSNAIKLLLKR